MSFNEITHAPISEAARFFHDRRGQIRFEDRSAATRRKFAEESLVPKTKNQLHPAAH